MITANLVSEQLTLPRELNNEEQKLWNILLNNASKNIHATKYEITINQLLTLWSTTKCDHKSEEELISALRHLAIKVKFKNKTTKGFFVLLPFAQVCKGICYYTFSDLFKKIISDNYKTSHIPSNLTNKMIN